MTLANVKINNGYCYMTEPLTPEQQQAFDIGEKVLAKIHNDRELMLCDDGSPHVDNRKHHVSVYTVGKPLTGIKWLKSLPVGTRILTDIGTKIVVGTKGLHFLTCADLLWRWGGTGNLSHGDWRKYGWVQKASPETCPEWTPET